jgi:hypothetical protein
MSKTWLMIGAFSLVSMVSFSASADVSDYLGGANGKPGKCPKVIVIRPDLSERNVFAQLDPSDFQSASNMVGSAVASKYEGADVFSAKDLKSLKACNVPVVLTKLKSYTREPAIFGQFEGKATITILHFASTNADTPDREVDVTANGERHWGDAIPFMNAIKAVCEQIQKLSL